MNARNLFRVNAVLFLITGLFHLFAPQMTMAANGMDNTPYGGYLLQILGTLIIALAVLAFLASRMAPSSNRQSAMITIIVQQALSAVVNLLAVLGGVIPSGMGWFGVALNIVLVLAYSYFLFIRPESAAAPELQT